jgi:PAS domain S-box-containing protein
MARPPEINGSYDPEECDRMRARVAELERAFHQSQDWLDAILESAVDYAILAADLEGRLTTWNEGARRIFGHEPNEALGEHIRFIYRPEDRAAGVPEAEMAAASAEGRARDERWHIRKDGSQFWASGMLMPLNNGHAQGFLKILRDRTELFEAEEALKEAARRQEIMAREASHRVKNNLQLISSLLNLQAKSSDNADVRAALADAQARIITVARVHDRLWKQNEMGSVDLAIAIGELCDDLQETSPDCRLSRELHSVTVPTEEAVPLMLITNELVTNAFKHACHNGEGQVAVRLGPVDQGRRLRLEVADRGPGLPEGFDPARATRGLGMRLITGFVRQLRGTLDAASAEPGTRFLLEVPLPERQASNDGYQTDMPSAQPSRGTGSGG